MFASIIKGLTIVKAAGPTSEVNEMMKGSGGFGTRWMTDLITTLSRKDVFQMIRERVSWCMCTG